MRAVYYEENGSHAVLKLGDVETPLPGRGEIRVRVVASGVNPSDVKSRAGRTRKIAFPRVIPHSDGAGIVDAVGEGVSSRRVGERVWVWNAQWKRAFGTCAEYVVLPETLAAPLPERTNFEEGACLGIPAMTAWQAVAAADTWAGSTLLISGGAGAVGHYAIQFAKDRGAVAIATVSSPAKAALARAAGADHTIDYRQENVGERVKELTDGAGVDAVIEVDLAANAALLPAVLRSGGKVVIYGTGNPGRGGSATAEIPAQWLLVHAATLQSIFVYEMAREDRIAAVETIGRLMEQGRLTHNIARRYSLAETARAHEAVESGEAAGNVVVTIS